MEAQLGAEDRRRGVSTFTEVFDEVFPEYLAMGMSYELFWLQDVTLARAYRRASTIRRDRHNFEMWIQGKYIYDAVGALAPILRAAMGKGRAKAEAYVKEPYPLDAKQAREKHEKERQARLQAFMEQLKVEAATKEARKK